MRQCLDSVQGWADDAGFDYRFMDDALFEFVDIDLRDKLRDQKVIASDLARLRWARQALGQGYDCVVWCDADFLIFDAPGFELPAVDCAVGREIWVQRERGRMRVYLKVHNAFMMYRRGNALLDFYADTAARLLRLNQGSVPPQFIGPKLLSALHNIARFPVMDTAGMLSPAVIRDLLAGGGPALGRFREASPALPAGVNLSASLCAAEGFDETAMSRLIETLLQDGLA